jgi:hypothetical protein
MPLLVVGGAVVGAVVIGGGSGAVVGGAVVGGAVVGGAVVGGVVVGGGGTVDVVGEGLVVCPAGVAGGCGVVAACELDVSVSGRTIAAAITTAIRTEMIVTRLVTCSP